MLFLKICFITGVLFSLFWGMGSFRKYQSLQFEHRLAAAFLPIALFLFFILFIAKIIEMPWAHLNACWLTPTMAIASGYNLYYGATDGPILNHIYGPIAALVFLPAKIAHTPTGAIIIAGFINALFIALPLLLFSMRDNWQEPKARVAGLMSFTFCIALLFLLKSTKYMSIIIHGDAPAVGLSALACFMLVRPKHGPNLVDLSVSAFLAVLAVWTKQVEAPLVLALITYLGIAHGRKSVFLFLACFLIIGSVVSFLMVTLFGFHDLVFNMFLIPSRHPYASSFIHSFVDLICRSSFLLLIILSAILITLEGSPITRHTFSDWMLENRWNLLVLASLFLIPTSVLGFAKVGGSFNSYHTHYFLIIASSMVLTKCALRIPQDKHKKIATRIFYLITAAAVILVLPEFLNLHRPQNLMKNPQEQAYEFARMHPGEAYFPWNPLSSLMAEGKLYHFEYGVTDRELAGFKPDRKHFRSYIPEKLRYVIFPWNAPGKKTLKYLPEFSRRIRLNEMKGWIVYERKE